MENNTFVYLLLNDEEVVYVGQTTQGLKRIEQHQKEKKKIFNNYKIISCIKKDLNELENFYILKYQPKYNKKLNSVNVNENYIILRLKDEIGFNPYSIKFIEKIIDNCAYKKRKFKNKNSIKKEDADIIVNQLLINFKSFNNECLLLGIIKKRVK